MKILVVHASAGAGHMKAAEAVYAGIAKHTRHQAVLVDVLDYTAPYFKSLYRGTYFNLISLVPAVWGLVFAMLDWPWLQPFVRAFRRLYNKINTQKFVRFLKTEQFDYIISAHFMPNEVAAALKRKGLITSKIIGIITDYDVHQIWLAQGIDYYAVATDWTKEKMIKLGIPSSKVTVSGIPTHEKFSAAFDIRQLKEKLGLKADEFSVLVATGSFGIGPIEEIADELKDFQVLVVCGHNKNLFERLSRKNAPHVKAFGLVDNMQELMAVSDVMVTKPGGLSISEALISHLPLVFFNAIPGQETNNVKVLKKYNVGLSGVPVKHIVDELRKFKASRDYHTTARNNAGRLARPAAVSDILALLK